MFGITWGLKLGLFNATMAIPTLGKNHEPYTASALNLYLIKIYLIKTYNTTNWMLNPIISKMAPIICPALIGYALFQ